MKTGLILIFAATIGCDIATVSPHLSSRLTRKADTVSLTITNDLDHATVPILVEVSIETPTGTAVLMHPVAFVLNRKESRDVTARMPAGSADVRARVVLKEGERGIVLKDETVTLAR